MNAKNFFSASQKALILNAIREAEMNTSGEIRVHLTMKCSGDLLDCASDWFEKLRMHKTALRNGVLFFIAINDRKFAILGDAGINAVVPEGFWDQVKSILESNFRNERFAEGLSEAILKTGQILKQNFPRLAGDTDELTNDLSFDAERGYEKE
jgi:uncharacterized membrane protein